MIIPILCVTCSNPIGDKYQYYLAKVYREKISRNIPLDKVKYLTAENTEKAIEGEVLDSMGLFNPCCRRHMLTHVDIE